jgi:hypothetical protein
LYIPLVWFIDSVRTKLEPAPGAETRPAAGAERRIEARRFPLGRPLSGAASSARGRKNFSLWLIDRFAENFNRRPRLAKNRTKKLNFPRIGRKKV